MAMARGTCRCRPVARDSVVIPMKVAPNKTAAASAAGTAPVRAGSAIPTAWRMRAPVMRVGRETCRLSNVHAAQEGTAAAPTMIQTLLDSHDGPVAEIAATRNVPATM
jgi:hypothetical protein